MPDILISPNLLSRIGGDSFEKIQNVNSKFSHFQKIIQKLQKLSSERKQLKDVVSADLYVLIGEISDIKIGDNLKKIRRMLFNEKILNDPDLNFIAKHASKSLTRNIERFIEVIGLIRLIDTELNDSYNTYEKSSRIQFMKILLKNQAVPRGLVLSSKGLLSDYLKYTQRKDVQYFEDLNTEGGLMRYLTRICTKTSPFSTFTNIGSSTISEEQGDLGKSYSKNNVSGHVRLNSALLKYIKTLIEKNDTINHLLKVSLNPSIQVYETHIKFLINSSNREAIQTIDLNHILETIIQYFNASKISVSYSRIYKYIQQVTGAEEKPVREYIQMLFDIGLLEFIWDFSSNDSDSDLKFLKQLTKYNKKLEGELNELISVLKMLNSACKAFAKANVKNRIKILNNTFQELRSCCRKLHISARLPEKELKSFDDPVKISELKKIANEDVELTAPIIEKKSEKFIKTDQTYFYFKPEQLFYEDTVRDSSFNFNQTEFSAIIKEIDDCLSLTDMFELLHDSRRGIYDFYIKKYSDAQDVPVLQFYEEYFKHLYDLKNSKAKITAKSIEGKWIQLFQRKVLKANQLNISEKITITNKIIGEVNSAFNIKPVSERTSHAAFFQPFYKSGKLNIVVNHIAPGYGKFISRFLHLLDSYVQKNLVELNAKTNLKNVINAELSDASHFNVNIHPPLMEYELSSPGGQGLNAKAKKIPISDISIHCNSGKSRLELRHNQSGKRVITFDLCFQNLSGRSQLFQLLNTFSDLRYHKINMLTNAMNKALKDRHTTESILTIPRVCLGENIILQRKHWKVPVKSIPVRRKGSSNYEYFMAINEWRLMNGIPEEVFISVGKRGEEVPFDINRVGSKNDYKPQYIHFHNPILIRMLEKEIRKVNKELSIYEMLPSSDLMFTINDKRFVTEFVTQWYKDKV